MTAYYNEFEKKSALWLENLIAAGLIAPGVVDTRSIEDVKPSDLRGFKQCHFFAGVGVWSYALRLAGWPDDRPVWSGSAPCQPFSQAGKGAGFNDQRHLWPAFQWLIAQCNPTTVVGEQVAGPVAGPWIDLIQNDLEGMGYATGAVAFPACSVGAPHIRQRLYWCGTLDYTGGKRWDTRGVIDAEYDGDIVNATGQLQLFPVVDADDTRSQRREGMPSGGPKRAIGPAILANRLEHASGWAQHGFQSVSGCGDGNEAGKKRENESGGIPNAEREICGSEINAAGNEGQKTARPTDRAIGCSDSPNDGFPGPVNGHWRAADWLHCRDGAWRPVEPGITALVDGTPARVVRIRAYGNAIVAPQAKKFIESVMDCLG